MAGLFRETVLEEFHQEVSEGCTPQEAIEQIAHRHGRSVSNIERILKSAGLSTSPLQIGGVKLSTWAIFALVVVGFIAAGAKFLNGSPDGTISERTATAPITRSPDETKRLLIAAQPSVRECFGFAIAAGDFLDATAAKADASSNYYRRAQAAASSPDDATTFGRMQSGSIQRIATEDAYSINASLRGAARTCKFAEDNILYVIEGLASNDPLKGVLDDCHRATLDILELSKGASSEGRVTSWPSISANVRSCPMRLKSVAEVRGIKSRWE